MTVVHCKVEDYDIYIGRGPDPRTGELLEWGNPFRLDDGLTREEAIEKYRVWLWGRIKSGKISVERLAELHGKRLGCWCAPKACHGEVLEKAAAWASKQ